MAGVAPDDEVVGDYVTRRGRPVLPRYVNLSHAMPLAHRAATALAVRGVRGARFYRPVAERLRTMPALPSLDVGRTQVLLDPDDAMTHALYHGYYETEELEVVARILHNGGRVVDVGANVGVFTFLAAAIVGETGAVLALEPSPVAAERLRATVLRASLSNVTVVEAAAGAAAGVATLTAPPRERGLGTLRAVEASREDECYQVEVVPVDALAVPGVGGEVQLLKIDTEGWEPHVFRGAEALLASRCVQAMLFELSPQLVDPSFVRGVAELLGEGFGWFVIEPRIGVLRITPRLRRVTLDDLVASTAQENVLVLRQDVLDRNTAILALVTP